MTQIKNFAPIIDKAGNSIRIIGINKTERTIKIKLAAESYERIIGSLDTEKKILRVKREAKHIFYRSMSFGFNYHIIKDSKHIDFVLLQYDGSEFMIPKDVILREGQVLNFKNASEGQSFELQIMLKIERIREFKTDPAI